MGKHTHYFEIVKILLVIIGLILSINLYGYNCAEKVKGRMASFFSKTLTDTYGEKPKEELFLNFLMDYKESNGRLELRVNKEELEAINKVVFKDKCYYYFYPRLMFYDSYSQFESFSISEEEKRNTIFFFGKDKNSVTEYGIYFNKTGYFEKFVSINSGLEQVRKIEGFYSSNGILSYSLFVDIIMTDTTVLENNSIYEFTVISFWKYLCDQVGIEFYK